MVGFAIKGIMDCRARQDSFAKFIVVKTAKVLSVFYKELIVGKRAMCIKI